MESKFKLRRGLWVQGYKDLRKCAIDLENAFFLEEDKKLIERLNELKKLEETKQNLAKVSGIKNDQILQKFVDLNVHPETLAALSVISLIEVAWADGNMDDREKEAILNGMSSCDIIKDDPLFTLVEQWLKCPLPKELLEAWVHYIKGLKKQLNDQDLKTLKDNPIISARAVAEAAGGFLGLTSKILNSEAEIPVGDPQAESAEKVHETAPTETTLEPNWQN